MNIVDFTETHAASARRLAQAQYDAECALVPALPQARAPDLWDSAKNGLGVAAFEGDEMLGFLCVHGPFKNAFGSTKVKGVWSPVHAHAAVGAKTRVYHRMYQAAAEKWVAAGALSHAVTLYAHDEEAKQAWFTYGFGMRSIDAIKLIDADAAVPKGDFFELPRERFGDIQKLGKALNRHCGESPIFMNRRFSPDIEGARFFAAKQEEKIVAYIKIRETGECFASHAPDMMNVCGVYALPEVRGTGLYAGLLRYTEAVLTKEGYLRLGVDYEGFNPTALYFYPKHFAVYTNSVVRRIDERGTDGTYHRKYFLTIRKHYATILV